MSWFDISTQPGSAPARNGKPGYVYRLGLANGRGTSVYSPLATHTDASRGNVDEYSPIFDPEDWKKDGNVYEQGVPGLVAWGATLAALLAGGAYASAWLRSDIFSAFLHCFR